MILLTAKNIITLRMVQLSDFIHCLYNLISGGVDGLRSTKDCVCRRSSSTQSRIILDIIKHQRRIVKDVNGPFYLDDICFCNAKPDIKSIDCLVSYAF